ncbi:hypothetical protein T310_1405 [Rasamsonia emersonii CBS 393.64]|uniref:Integral membrane protein n=1 Tax=Rasamsonia emersonii (strain ATCC 16479 / CBS 393.64 / IMI 116815) TaxID=1408163 RepID=A0A0F4Z3A5_RASE3|nr:hypothetical protein T310_1405 [Rasamsonia emersonii CBS 393.64]KKA24571.1 hypothetical protein T310_1405 [Rasamsonia emersonii CBS 393.64]
MPPPPGVVPDFSLTRTTVQQKFIVVYSVTLAIAIVLLALRLYTRGAIVHSYGWDDWAVVSSAVFSIAFFALCVEASRPHRRDLLLGTDDDQILHSAALPPTQSRTQFPHLRLHHHFHRHRIHPRNHPRRRRGLQSRQHREHALHQQSGAVAGDPEHCHGYPDADAANSAAVVAAIADSAEDWCGADFHVRICGGDYKYHPHHICHEHPAQVRLYLVRSHGLRVVCNRNELRHHLQLPSRPQAVRAPRLPHPDPVLAPERRGIGPLPIVVEEGRWVVSAVEQGPQSQQCWQTC